MLSSTLAFVKNDIVNLDEEHYQNGIKAYWQGDSVLACLFLEQAIVYNKFVPQYYVELMEMYRASGKLDDARRIGRQGTRFVPNNVRIECALGFLFYDCNMLTGAIRQFENVIEHDLEEARAHTGLGMALLADGQWKRGWQEFEWRFRMHGYREIIPSKPKWLGQEIDSTLLLICGEGFGDTIQFMRYIPQIRERCGGRLIILCKTELQPLIEPFLQDKDCVVDNWRDVPAFDLYCVLTSVAGLLNGDPPKTFAPYIYANDKLVREWQGRIRNEFPSGLRIGLVWAGSSVHFNDFRRSIDFSQLIPLTEIPGVVAIGLQKDVARISPWMKLDLEEPIINYGPQLRNWDDTAALVANLDLVISIDSAVAHLAGAMGKPVWVLLPYAAEWRWGKDRSDTHWYQSMRLFRQSRPGDWAGVISQVKDAIQKELVNRSGDRHELKELQKCPL